MEWETNFMLECAVLFVKVLIGAFEFIFIIFALCWGALLTDDWLEKRDGRKTDGR